MWNKNYLYSKKKFIKIVIKIEFRKNIIKRIYRKKIDKKKFTSFIIIKFFIFY